jgi:hypothetical protein
LLTGAKRTAETARTTQTAWWIISRVRGGRTEAMTVPRGAGEELAVFGHEEEARLFLWSLGPGKHGWRVAETRCGELASVLCGPCKGARGVALDPLPELLEDGTLASVGVGRERFLARLLGLPRPGPAACP